MRIAIVSDIHGNIDALNAVIQSTEFVSCDVKINLGDSIGYYLNPYEVLIKLKEFNFISIKGNHEEILEKAISSETFLREATEKFGLSFQICIESLNESQLEDLFNLPQSKTIPTEMGNIVLFHGSPVSSTDYVYPDADLTEIARNIPSGCKWMILGNTHWPMLRRVGFTTIINPGSVGQSRNGSGMAHWAILDTQTSSITFLEVAYDSSELISRLKRLNPLLPNLWEVLLPK
jgi:putative phosphoesterase